MIDVRQRHRVRDRNTTLVLLPHSDSRRLLIESDTEALQLALDDCLVAERLENVEHDENEVACPRN